MAVYTALGNSVTFGEGASSPGRAYPSLVVCLLRSSGVPAVGQVFAQPGWTSADLAAAVLDDAADPIRHSTAVSILIGGNDLIAAGLAALRGASGARLASTLASYKRNLSVIVAAIHRWSRARIICCTVYNPFPNTPLAAQSVNELNRIIEHTAQSRRVSIAPVHAWFEGKEEALIAGYRTGKIEDALRGTPPIHPNDRGHRLIAEGLLPFVRTT